MYNGTGYMCQQLPRTIGGFRFAYEVGDCGALLVHSIDDYGHVFLWFPPRLCNMLVIFLTLSSEKKKQIEYINFI